MSIPIRFAPLALLILGMTTLSTGAQPPTSAWRSSPEWARDLVIYEIATKAFTSPNGPESGTFESLRARLPYLQELGITGIWLTGHSLADPHHFYNIWTQYAVIEPDKLDPSLGTPEQFKAMIDEAHGLGIKIFLDVIDHGVMAGSSLIKAHPEWFRGGSWGMVDYDYLGGHLDFEDWWVELWTRMVTEYGVDGYRLDTNTRRPDLWARIRRNAAAAGHPIVIWEEKSGTIPGVTDFSQQDNRVTYLDVAGFGLGDSHLQIRRRTNAVLADNVPGYFDRMSGKTGRYQVELLYPDGTRSQGGTDETGALQVRLDGVTADKASRRASDRSAMPDGIPDVQLTVANATAQPIAINVSDDNGGRWRTMFWQPAALAVEGKAPELRLYLAARTRGSSIQLSSHDDGWEGFSQNESPYVAQGSRAVFGYSFLFTPMLPIFMSGEEFDATFHPLPNLSPNLFGGKNPGKGRWLYGAMLDWNELQQPEHRAMFEDVKRMLAIRRHEAAVLGPEPGDIEPRLIAVPYTSDIDVPVPYMRWNGEAAIVVLANRNTDADAHLQLHIPLEKLGAAGAARYRVADLWSGGKARVYSANQLQTFPYTVKRDKTPRGGVGVLRIETIR